MRVAIVDGFSTGKFLAPELVGRGLECVHIQSDPELPEFFIDGFRAADYVDTWVHTGERVASAAWLRRHGVGAVVAGCEAGVDLAEELAADLKLPRNGRHSPGARRNKALMVEALQRGGVRAPNSCTVQSTEVAVAWVRAHGQWPVVAKPLDSAGTDNVFFCRDVAAVEEAVSTILRSVNLMGQSNCGALVQEFLEGREFFINTVSLRGRHHVAEIWRYHKTYLPGRGHLYDYEEPVAWQDPIRSVLAEYTFAVLDALDVCMGPAHSEVMMTARGPILLETGARLAGSVLPTVVRRCFGTSQVELTAAALANPEGFAQLLERPYEVRSSLRYVSLTVPEAGVVSSEGLAAVRQLKSFAGMLSGIAAGAAVAKTVDSKTSPGVVYLFSEDAAQVVEDYNTLRQLERTQLYSGAPVTR
jgi:biotin carboxylase